MNFENPLPKEGINVSPRNHIKDFFILTIGTFVLILVSVFVLGLLAGYLAKRIPFETELVFSNPFDKVEVSSNPNMQNYVDQLVEKIANCSDLPDGMIIKNHYQVGEIFNAFATLGGNIIIYQGLIDELDNENQLAMIIAHEIAHIKNRHPIQAVGRVMIVSISISLLMGNSATNPLEGAGLLTLLQFNRNMESEADADGLKAVQQCYGHINGAASVFEKLEKIQAKEHPKPLPFLSTHPLNEDRIKDILKLAFKNSWQVMGDVAPIPMFE